MSSIMKFVQGLMSQQEVVKWCSFWFGANLTITFFNKYALNRVGIPPTVNTFAHLLTTFAGCCVANKFEFPKLTRNEVYRLFVYSFVFAFNIVYSQYGMKLTSLSLNQVTRATTPVYQAMLECWLMSREHKTYNLIPLIPVIAGVALTSLGDVQVTMLGLFVSISSVLISALKGVLSMKILQKDLKTKLQEYTFLMFVAPMALVWIAVFEFFFVRQMRMGGFLWSIAPDALARAMVEMVGSEQTSSFADLPWPYLIIGGILAFLTNIASFGTVKRTSASAMGVMANAKQAIIILSAMLLAEKDWTPTKMFGVVVTICGAIWYSYRKEVTRSKAQPVPIVESNENEEGRMLLKEITYGNNTNRANGIDAANGPNGTESTYHRSDR